MGKLLIIGAGPLQVPLILKAKELGLYTVAVDYNPEAPGAKLADDFYAISTSDQERIVQLADDLSIDGVVTNSDFPVRVASIVGNNRGLPGISPLTATIATNKLLLREILRENQINQPKFFKVSTLEDVRYFNTKLGLPWIIKPVDSSASRGVSLVVSESQIEYAFHRAQQNSKSSICIMEEYVTGEEYSIESFTNNGHTEIIAITQKVTSGPPYFVETGHIIPAPIDDELKRHISNYVKDVIKSIHFTCGPTHTEIKVKSDKEIVLIEIGPRLGGDYITTDLVPFATGYDIVENTIRAACNMELINFDTSGEKCAGVLFIKQKKGVFKGIEGWEEILSKPYVKRGELFVNIGDSIDELQSSQCRIGYLILNTDRYADIESAFRTIEKELHLIIT
ncbi:ATP-grasp domain-containing protein [Paenibacillus sp. HJGM_3]|uniref:ATP-grasp domain-containing protein n=1 Tax=Paenibacillus sp. HJGM_3 TaxID=3379816 RepID=UPI00385966E7